MCELTGCANTGAKTVIWKKNLLCNRINWVSRIEEQRKRIKNNEEKNPKLLFDMYMWMRSQLILLQRRFFWAEIYRGRLFCRAELYRGRRFFFRADRSLGAKQEGLTIVHFLNKLIVIELTG
jgi:hypothetical protein